MVDHRSGERASGFPRLLVLLGVVAGIVTMHAGVFLITAGHAHAAQPTMATASAPEHASAHQTDRTATDTSPETTVVSASVGAQEHQDCDGTGCDAHGGIHPCVFILSVFALVLGLVLLFRLPGTRPGGIVAKIRYPARRERPPPWTILSLSELSILRI